MKPCKFQTNLIKGVLATESNKTLMSLKYHLSSLMNLTNKIISFLNSTLALKVITMSGSVPSGCARSRLAHAVPCGQAQLTPALSAVRALHSSISVTHFPL